jgi:hypothetical protein
VDPGVVGVAPVGLPVNVRLTEAPPCLFHVKAHRLQLQVGGAPWHALVAKSQHQVKVRPCNSTVES